LTQWFAVPLLFWPFCWLPLCMGQRIAFVVALRPGLERV